MHDPQTRLKLGPIPKRLHLRRGEALLCSDGCLWVTSDALAGLGPASDVVLERGQSFVAPQAAIYFVGAPLGCGVVSVVPPATPAHKLLEAAC